MLRATISFCLVIIFLSGLTGFCQGIPQWSPTNCRRPPIACPHPPAVRPTVRTVQVDVPAPCPPAQCGYPIHYRPHPCAPPACAPPPPTRPVRVRVDVVVRPEKPKQGCPQRYCCMNPPVFEPVFCRAAGVLRSMLLAPLCIGERFLGHGTARPPCPPPIPIECPACPVPPCRRILDACRPLPYQCLPLSPSSAGCTLNGEPTVRKVKCGPGRIYAPYGNAPIHRQ